MSKKNMTLLLSGSGNEKKSTCRLRCIVCILFLEQAILNKALSTFIVFILMRTEVQIIFNKMIIFKCNFVYTCIF